MNLDGVLDDFYENHYEKLHGEGALGLGGKLMHSFLERGRSATHHHSKVLELGCGNFEHFPYLKHNWDEFTAVDLRVPSDIEARNFMAVNGTKFVKSDVSTLPFEDNSFDRVLATCLVLHIQELPNALEEWQRVTRKSGFIDLLIPCETGVAHRFMRSLVSKPNARRRGIDSKSWKLINALDHVNSFPRAISLLEASIIDGRSLEISFFPFGFLPSPDVNLFARATIGPIVP
jgi:SAM-dependent methyltransferase